ncbi:hypothetical protein ASD85_09785 [Rhizobium sp. Root651]|nr:hypothetical protein ASD85_09785 [Rhizobium sp. Root651]
MARQALRKMGELETCASPPHSCARHRNPADARLHGGKSPFSPRTWADWIPVTSTGMRAVEMLFTMNANVAAEITSTN